jgi:drug/metabolite transporter (DMT)-like permease
MALTDPVKAKPMQNTQGIFSMILAMAGFTIEDMFIKQLSATVSVGQILVLLGIGSGLIFAFVAYRAGQSLVSRPAWRPIAWWRMFAEGVAAIFMTVSLWLVDFSVVAAVFQATPLTITLGAALFLGEDVGWRRWTAIAIGFLGVLLIIRPGFAGFEPSVIFVLGAVLAVSARDLITRRMDRNVATSVVAFQGFAALVPAGLILSMVTGGGFTSLSTFEFAILVGTMLSGALAYYTLIQSTRIADAAVVTPFRYTRLVFSLFVGVLVFQERPDMLTLLGATLIIATGLYTFFRERRLALEAAASR